VPWRRWGPYLAERAWGTVREDTSADGNVWGSFTYEDACRRAYRWNEDGLLGICDDEQRLCLALALWNERDSILKERLFGLTNPEGNHGEDVKELYFYLDAVPSSAYLRAAYLYPHAPFPYAELRAENARRTADDPEFELLDTEVFNDDRFFEVVITYAKAGPEELVMRIEATNWGPEAAPLHLLPTVWFRKTWSRGASSATPRPRLSQIDDELLVEHPSLGRYRLAGLAVGTTARWLFTDNETADDRGEADGAIAAAGAGNDRPRFAKDAFHRYLIDGDAAAVNPAGEGTKAALHARWIVPPGGTVRLDLALTAEGCRPPRQLLRAASRLSARRAAEADAFYAGLATPSMTADERRIQRQALAGLLWSFQYYHYDVHRWRQEDGMSGSARVGAPNRDWDHLRLARVLSVPDSWEFPWFAAWDLAFQALALHLVDPDRAKEQLLALLDPHVLHPSGQLPSCEWEFSDTNPPVQAWVALQIYRREKALGGRPDRAFLERMLHGLALNFGWWVNRRDRGGRNLFEGGFLGLDNISIVDRSALEATGTILEQADATGWMALFALGLTEMALELALEEPIYVELAKHFLDRFVAIGEALARVGGEGLWDPEARFFFDLIHRPGQQPTRVKAFSVVGLVPVFAVGVLDSELLENLPEFARYLEELAAEHPNFFAGCDCFARPHPSGRRLLAIVDEHRLLPILDRVLDEAGFLSPFGVRSVSRRHADPALAVDVSLDGLTARVDYEPGEARTKLKGGNSNWRGPVWLPINYLLWAALRQYGRYYGDALVHSHPAPNGKPSSLTEIADELADRLLSLYRSGSHGHCPALGADPRWASHPAFRHRLLFFEYFHGETGKGLGASHQTGWTALLANLIDELHGPGHGGEGSVGDTSGPGTRALTSGRRSPGPPTPVAHGHTPPPGGPRGAGSVLDIRYGVCEDPAILRTGGRDDV
jgi:hypothetical protein